MSKIYDAAKKEMLASSLFQPGGWGAPQGAVLYGEQTVPCRHKKKKRRKDAKRGRPHGKTHVITVPLMAVALVESAEVKNDESVTLNWDSDGVAKLS